ncbi:ANTAR domain-containing protein [Streptomyces sp. NPDC096032]|uniref:ANTAR domain-containing protein n=1 Tax=Streptomyces sp. NPDC096032 TaxID=3366070 RepID=UPI0037FE4C9C
MTVQPVTDRAVVLRLWGTLDAQGAGTFGRELDLRLKGADERGLPLVLDLSGVVQVSSAAVGTLAARTGHRTGAPVLVAGATPHVRTVLSLSPLPGVRLYPDLEGALATLCGAGDAARAEDSGRYAPVEEPSSEVYGLRAKARTSGLIGIAQGILIARYGLSGPAAAFAVLRAGSQHHNVPLRVLASAVVTAPPPPAHGDWFPGRRHVPPPSAALLTVDRLDARDRLQVLKAAVYRAVTMADADAAEIHLTDRVQDEALVLEAHHGLDPAYRDCLALVLGPPAVCARARAAGRPVTVPDVAAEPDLAGHPVGRAALGAGIRAVHGAPMMTDRGECNGVLSVHRSEPGVWLTAAQEDAVHGLARDLAAWRSWYRRTVVQDALEHVHALGAAGG